MKIRLKTIPCPLYGLGPESTPVEWARAMHQTYLLFHLHGYDVRGRTMKVTEVAITVHDNGGHQWTVTLFAGRDGYIAVREEGYGELDFGELATQLAWQHPDIVWVGLTLGECVDKGELSFIDNLFYGWEWLKSIISRNENFTVIKEKNKMNSHILTLIISFSALALLAWAAGDSFAAHRERISALENEVQQLKWATDLNEAKVDNLLEGTVLAKRLTESEGPIRIANVTLMDNVMVELREAIDRYLSSRGLEKEGGEMRPMYVPIPYRGKVYAFWRNYGQVYVNGSPAHRQGRCCGEFLKYNGTSLHHFRHVCLSWLRGHYKLKGFRK